MSEDCHDSDNPMLINCEGCGRSYDPEFTHVCRPFDYGRTTPMLEMARVFERNYDELIITPEDAADLQAQHISIEGLIIREG